MLTVRSQNVGLQKNPKPGEILLSIIYHVVDVYWMISAIFEYATSIYCRVDYPRTILVAEENLFTTLCESHINAIHVLQSFMRIDSHTPISLYTSFSISGRWIEWSHSKTTNMIKQGCRMSISRLLSTHCLQQLIFYLPLHASFSSHMIWLQNLILSWQKVKF